MTGVKRLLIVVGLCGLLALTGCSSVTVEVTVAGDATIDSYSVEATMPQTVFEQLQSQTENGQSVCDSVRSDFNRSNYDEYDCSTRSSNGNVTLEYQLRNWNTSDFDRITVSRTGEGNVTYVDTLQSQSDVSDAQVTYTVQMPGQVYETNGQVGDDGQTVTWKKEPGESNPRQVSAESGVSPGPLDFLSVRLAIATISFVLAGAYVGALRSDKFDIFDL